MAGNGDNVGVLRVKVPSGGWYPLPAIVGETGATGPVGPTGPMLDTAERFTAHDPATGDEAVFDVDGLTNSATGGGFLFEAPGRNPTVVAVHGGAVTVYKFPQAGSGSSRAVVATTDDVAGRVRKPDFDNDSAGSHFVSWSSTASGNPMTNVHAVGSHTITLDADCMINFYGRTGGGTRTVQISVNGCVIHGGAVGADYVFNCFTICNAGDVVTITVESSAFRWINAAVRWL